LFIFTGFSIFYAIKFTGAAFVALPVMVFAGFLVAGWYDSKLKKGIYLRLDSFPHDISPAI
jgi:hypothetical protein